MTTTAATTASSRTGSSSCAYVTATVPIAWALPCLPAAQVATAVGGAFGPALVTYGAIFGLGAVSVIASTLTTTNPPVAFDPAMLIVPWVAFALGPLTTAVIECIVLLVVGLRGIVNEEKTPAGRSTRDFDYAACALIVLWNLCNVALAAGVVRLRHRLHAMAVGTSSSLLRSSSSLWALSTRFGCCGDVLAGLCPCCELIVLGAMVKRESGVGPCHIGPLDVLPAFETTTAV